MESKGTKFNSNLYGIAVWPPTLLQDYISLNPGVVLLQGKVRLFGVFTLCPIFQKLDQSDPYLNFPMIV